MAINSSKVDEEQKEVLKSATIRRLFSYLKNYKRQVAVVLVVLAVTIAISTVNPLLLEYAIDVNIAQKDWRGLVALCVFMVVINLVYAAGVRLRMLLMARITNNILLEIRDELYTHIQTLSFSFFDTRPAGKILARIIGDVNSLKDVLNDGVTKLIPNILTIIAILVIMMIKNIWLSLSAILVLPLIAVGMFISSLTESQLVAAIVTIVVDVALLLVDSLASLMPTTSLQNLIMGLSMADHYGNFTMGILDFADAFFFLSIIALFIFLTSRVLEKRRWG